MSPVRLIAALILNCDKDFVPLNSIFKGLCVWVRLSNVFAQPEKGP
jgi:hypothetical protein